MRKKVKRPFSGGYRGPERGFTGIKSYICRKEKTDWKYGKRGFEWMVVGGDRALVGRGLVWASLSRRVARGGVALRRGVGRDYRLVPDDPVSRLFRAGEDQPQECPFSCWRACRHVAAFADRADLCRLRVRSEELAESFLKALPSIRDLLATDAEATFDGDPAATNLREVIFCYPGLRAIANYRVAHCLFQLGVPYIPRMITEMAHRETGIDIHPGAVIGHHFSIDHGTGTVIGETSEIGNHVRIFQGVSLAGAKLGPIRCWPIT